MRARVVWKYLLGLELTDPDFDHTVLSEFRSRLVAGQAEQHFSGLLQGRELERGIKLKMKVKLAAKLLVITWTLMKRKEQLFRFWQL